MEFVYLALNGFFEPGTIFYIPHLLKPFLYLPFHVFSPIFSLPSLHLWLPPAFPYLLSFFYWLIFFPVFLIVACLIPSFTLQIMFMDLAYYPLKHPPLYLKLTVFILFALLASQIAYAIFTFTFKFYTVYTYFR